MPASLSRDQQTEPELSRKANLRLERQRRNKTLLRFSVDAESVEGVDLSGEGLFFVLGDAGERSLT